jgi:nucleolar protein 15
LQPKTDEQKESITKRLIKREEAKRAKLASLGIDYDFSGYAGKAIAAPEPVKAAKAVKAKAVKAKKEKKVEEVSSPLLCR